jgi:outer membrane protein, heavy metal efflux system
LEAAKSDPVLSSLAVLAMQRSCDRDSRMGRRSAARRGIAATASILLLAVAAPAVAANGAKAPTSANSANSARTGASPLPTPTPTPTTNPVTPPASVATPIDGELNLEQAMAIAMAANGELAAARLQLPIAAANLAVAAERPNPDLLLEALRETPRQSATLSLPIETAAKRDRRMAAASADAARGEVELARTAATLRNRVRRVFYALLAAERRAIESLANLEEARRAADAAQQRFTAGAAPHLEALQAELTVAQASNDAEAAQAQLLSGQADLNTLLGRPPQTAVNAVGDLAAGGSPESAAVLERAQEGSADLALLDHRIAAQRARVLLAKAQQVPNPVLQGAITHDAQPDFVWGWRAGLTVTLPLFTTHRGEVEVEETTLAQLKAERDAASVRIAGEVAAATTRAAAARRQAQRFRDDILPRALEVEQLAEESYRAGETGLVALLQALQAARDVRLRAIQAGLDFQVAMADLEQAVGVPMPW